MLRRLKSSRVHTFSFGKQCERETVRGLALSGAQTGERDKGTKPFRGKLLAE
jgi:hypothetical protein